MFFVPPLSMPTITGAGWRMFLRSLVMIDTDGISRARAMRGCGDEDGMVATMIERLRGRQEWQFFRALRRASPAYAIGWWVLIVMRGALPAVTSIAFGWLVSAITRHMPHWWARW